MSIMDWKVGDRAYISGEPASGYLAGGSIVPVTMLTRIGEPITGFGASKIRLLGNDRKPLRILTPGDVVPRGAKYLRILGCGKPEQVTGKTQWAMPSESVYAYAIISLPEPDPSPDEVKRAAMLARIATMEAELEGLRAEVQA